MFFLLMSKNREWQVNRNNNSESKINPPDKENKSNRFRW